VTAPRTIAVGYDASPDSESAVLWTFHNAEPHDSVIIVHAIGLLEHLRTTLSHHEMPPRLSELARACGFDERHLHWYVDDGDACSALLRAVAPPINASLLVVGSRGLSHRAGLPLGSTSLEVVQHATIPVVVVPTSYASS
jgi:nucleotide-binding universal stress UspA family protein